MPWQLESEQNENKKLSSKNTKQKVVDLLLIYSFRVVALKPYLSRYLQTPQRQPALYTAAVNPPPWHRPPRSAVDASVSARTCPSR